MSNINLKKLILPNLPYVLFVYLFDKVAQAVRLAPGADLSGKLLAIGNGFSAAFASPLPSFHGIDILVGIAGAVIIRLVVYTKGKNAKKYRKGMEYGSARWGNAEDIKPYIDSVFENNVLLTQTERLMMSSRPKQPKYARNKNILVIGGSGSGKTRFFVKPNLMQMHSSYVVTDPKGTVLIECGKLLQRGGYKIKVLNTINFKKSMRYNPFAYLRSEKDILKLVNTIIANTKGDGDKSGEDFWVKAEKLYYTALIGYIWYEAPEAEKNFTTLLEMINASEAREDDEDFQNPVDLMFERLEEKDPEHFAVKQYKKYKLAAGKTAKSILISCGARLAPFDIRELRELMETDEMELDTIGDRKTALFVIISDTDDTFNFVVSILYTQLFNLLCDKADDVYGGRLPVHVRCLLDEFANIGQIPKFEKLIATIRSREISASIILQSQSQLKAIYKDNADTIVGNCDTTLFLGGKEKTTLKEMSELLGKETIDSFNTSETRSNQKSYGLNYQKLGKELMSQDEIAVMDGGKCILQLRGVRPFFSDKFDITKHTKYKYLSDADPKNAFDMEKHIKRRPAVVKPDEVFDELKSSLETIRATAAEIINSIDGHLQEIQKEREAQQTAEQVTPVFDKLTPEQQTELSDGVKAMLQTLIDADMQAHGEVTDGTLEAISTQGYFYHDGELTKADPAAEPTVTVVWSESNKLRDGQTMLLSEADKLFASLDEANKDIPGYDKTAFRIDFVMNGKADSYEGRQDFGDGDGGLIAHIESYHAYYADNPDWDNYLLRNKGKEALDADKAQREMLLHEFVPYLKLHTNLSEMEQAAKTAMRRGEDLTQTETAYYTAMQQYVSDYRGALNQGSYELPPVPQLADFDAELQAYKQQVREEIAQEAASADMTVEEYAANGYEPYAAAPEAAEPDKDTFSIYQLKRGDETRDLRFEPYDRLIATGHSVDAANYDLIYTAELTPDMTLGSIWETFNIDHPKDFKGHSLSVSDIVVLHQNGQDTAHYVDSIGYQQVPEFLQPAQEMTLTPDELTTGEQITTPRGSFHVTAMTREQMEAAGYGFHHQSEDGKHLIMGNGTRAFAVAAEQPEKANPLKHVEDTIEQNDNNFDGLINNTPQTPTVDALEQKAKSGEPISLTELADAIKADKQRGGKGKEEKPSIRAQLKAGKEKTAPKKAAKAKNHDLEV